MTEEQAKQLADVHAALFDVPAGSPEDAKPLIQDIYIMRQAFYRGSWLVRIVVGILGFVSLIGGVWVLVFGEGSGG